MPIYNNDNAEDNETTKTEQAIWYAASRSPNFSGEFSVDELLPRGTKKKFVQIATKWWNQYAYTYHKLAISPYTGKPYKKKKTVVYPEAKYRTRLWNLNGGLLRHVDDKGNASYTPTGRRSNHSFHTLIRIKDPQFSGATLLIIVNDDNRRPTKDRS